MENPRPLSVAAIIESFGHLLTVEELAQLLSVSTTTLYKEVAAGLMPSSRISGAIRFDPADTAAWLRSSSVQREDKAHRRRPRVLKNSSIQ